MPKSIPEPEILAYDDIRDEVDRFVADFQVAQTIPVDVERIADAMLGLDIVPVPGLRTSRDIEGYLSADRTAIYVDEQFSAGPVLHRHRFTIAHEVGHWYLHEDLYTAAVNPEYESFVDFINAIPEESWWWYEWQARAFAGLLLAPRAELKDALAQAAAYADVLGFRNFDPAVEAHRTYAAEWIAKRFEVSPNVILKRGAKDGLWS